MEKFNRTPFKESLKPTNYDSRMVKIRELKSQKDILIREHELEEGEDLNELIKSHSEGKKLFEKMSSEYGIKMVSMNSIIGKNEEGKTAFFTIVDKIEGENLSKVENLPTKAEEELNALYCSLGQHYYDAWKQKSKYWADGNNSQFIYGHKYGEKDDHFFLVDIDARFFRQGENELFPIEWLVRNICEGLVKAENKFQPKISLKEARDKLLGIISEMQEDKPDDEWLLKARNLLET